MDWHSQEFMPGQPGYGQQNRNNSSGNIASGNIASNSYPSMSRLGLTGQPNPRASIDRDFMDLEQEIMGLGGSEVNYDFQKGNIPDIDIASDIQEQSVGEKSPNFRTAPLADTVDTVRSPAASARRLPQRDGANTPSRGGKVPLAVPTIRGESVAANTPKTTAIQINIQPPTDPALSRVPSMALHDSPTKRSAGVSGTVRAQSPVPASSSPLRNASNPPGAARPSPLSQHVPEPQPPLPSTPGTPATPVKAPPVVAPPVESQPPVQSETAPAPTATAPTKKGKMAKKKARGGAAKKIARARDEEDMPTPPPEPEPPVPPMPVLKSPTIPAMGVQVTNKFSPTGQVESVTVSMPVPQAVHPTPSPAPSRALDLQATPQAVSREIPSRAPSRANNMRSPRVPSRSVTPAPGGHTPRDSFDFNAPLPGSTNVGAVPLPDPHSTDYAMSPSQRSRLGKPEEGTVTVRGAPPRSRAESRASELRSPTIKGGTVRNEPLDPRLNGGDTQTLQKFLDSNTPRVGTKPLGGSRVPSEHPASPSRASERARVLADDGFGADGRRQEEFVSVPASQFRPSSRASNTPTATPMMLPRGEPSLTDMWHRFQGGEAVAPELDHHEPPPASPISPVSPGHSRAGSRLLDAPGKTRSKQSSVAASPAPQTSSHFRQPAAARDSILSRLDELPSAVPRSPSVRGHGFREPSVREPSVREQSFREPSVREPSVRTMSPPPEHTPPPPRGHTPQPASPAPSFPMPEHLKNPTSPRRRPPPSDITYTDARRDSRMSLPSPSQAAFGQPRSRGPENGRREKSVSQELAALERMEEEDDDVDGPAIGRRSPAVAGRERMTAKEAMDVLKTPGTSYSVTPSALAAEVNKSHFHDEDLCVLLHAADDPTTPDVVRKAVRKAVRSRVKKLGLENEDQYRMQHLPNKGKHKHRISYAEGSAKAPEWARPLFQLLEQAQERLDSLDSKLESSRPGTELQRRPQYDDEDGEDDYLEDDYEPGSEINRTPRTPHQRIGSQEMDSPPNGASHFRRGDRRGYEAEEDMEYDDAPHGAPSRESGIEEQLYRLKMKNPRDYEESVHSEAPIPEIPGSDAGRYFDDARDAATPTPRRAAVDVTGETSQEVTPHSNGPAFVRPREHWTGGSASNWGVPSAPPWQLVHQRLLNWTIVWSMSEIDRALESTERGRQVDECALTVWTMQAYKRYVRVKTTDHPPQKVDRLFVPPNVADAINSAVYNGRHADATVMLKDLWTPYGFDEMPRLILVLARHRRDNNHWVVHRFSIPEGTLCTYDTYPEKALADGRPLGWWFAIRAAWPHAMYPNPDHLVQKLVRIHRPLQLLIDNSVAAAAIWRNLLMGSKAERSVDLVRMRDLVHTEVRAMKLRKEQGKLALPASRASWDHQITES
ncbi:hypothetical protein FRC00_001986 [Tulasnella sp. 408]|nr:hypothetical protein FRC00_001986 [Tulasnella sp. 408]